MDRGNFTAKVKRAGPFLERTGPINYLKISNSVQMIKQGGLHSKL